MPFPDDDLFPADDVFPGPPDPSFTLSVLGDYVPWINEDSIEYLNALADMFESVYGIVVDQGNPDGDDYVPGWSNLLDPDACPTAFLPFLSQFNGTAVQPGTDDATARTLIKTESGYWRGTLAAMSAAAQRNLTGTKNLTVLERTASDGSTQDAYHMVFLVQASQCPDLPLLELAVEAQKPGGIQITYIVVDGFTWIDAINTWTADTMTWQQADTEQP